MIERKGVDVYKAANKIHIWIASNEQWVVPAGADARRFFCLNVSDERRNDTVHFGAIAKQMENGGRAALLDLLLKHPLADIRQVPQTAALAEQKAQSRRGVDALVEMIAMEGSIPCADQFDPSIAIITDPASCKTFHDIAKKLIPSLKYETPIIISRTLRDEWGCTRWHKGNRRGLRFPELAELRDRFVKKHGPVEWPATIRSWDND